MHSILAKVSSADSYFQTTNFFSWLLIALLFWFLGLLIGWFIWRNSGAEADAIEAENRQLREEETRLRN